MDTKTIKNKGQWPKPNNSAVSSTGTLPEETLPQQAEREPSCTYTYVWQVKGSGSGEMPFDYHWRKGEVNA